jgi:hypothetical protein
MNVLTKYINSIRVWVIVSQPVAGSANSCFVVNTAALLIFPPSLTRVAATCMTFHGTFFVREIASFILFYVDIDPNAAMEDDRLWLAVRKPGIVNQTSSSLTVGTCLHRSEHCDIYISPVQLFVMYFLRCICLSQDFTLVQT